MTVFALHGFLGQPQDFDGLGIKLTAPDYLKVRELSPANDLKSWGQAFNQFAVSQVRNETQRVLMGYSQGGRLALHAFKQNPSLWSGLVLISTNLGIPLWERAARREHDKQWADKFETLNFDQVVKQWNALPVFHGSQAEPVRQEKDYNRHHLAQCLTQWSLGMQEDFRDFLKTVQCPVLYISGEKDLKYVEIGKGLQKINPKIQAVTIPNSGHRVLFDQPKKVSHYFSQLCASIY